MLSEKRGMDIVSKIGGVGNYEGAIKIFKNYMDQNNISKMENIKSPEINIKIANIIQMCEPHSVFIHSGSIADRNFIKNLALKKGEESPLALDGHTVHFDLKEEQGRIIDRTFYIYDDGEKISSLANKIKRSEALTDVKSKMMGIMKGKTMIVGFYLRGPKASPVSNPAIEITSSAYVIHSADLLYRNAYSYFDQEIWCAKHFYTNIHSEGFNRLEDLPNARVYMDRAHQTTYSFNCTYAGNTLMLKKGNHRFSVDRAVYNNRCLELSEHMFITGIRGKNDRITWCAGASPSGCGKTTTAMAGDQFIGDDLAQFWIDEMGVIRAINPESGIFGILEDVNREGDPILMDCLRYPGQEVIWSNVLIDNENKPHWTGNGSYRQKEERIIKVLGKRIC